MPCARCKEEICCPQMYEILRLFLKAVPKWQKDVRRAFEMLQVVILSVENLGRESLLSDEISGEVANVVDKYRKEIEKLYRLYVDGDCMAAISAASLADEARKDIAKLIIDFSTE